MLGQDLSVGRPDRLPAPKIPDQDLVLVHKKTETHAQSTEQTRLAPRADSPGKPELFADPGQYPNHKS